jgi:hypothetical protein
MMLLKDVHRAGEKAKEIDALPSPGVNPLEGSPKCSCEKLGFRRRSRLPTLERGRGSTQGAQGLD